MASSEFGSCSVWLDMCPPLKRAERRGEASRGKPAVKGSRYVNTAAPSGRVVMFDSDNCLGQ